MNSQNLASPPPPTFHGTTILCVRKNGDVCLAGDGQVTFGSTILKHNTRKIRRLYNDKILAGFAGSTADAFTLFERFEGKIQEYHGQLRRACVELAKDWRSDRVLRRLEAMMILADATEQFLLSGSGDVIERDDGLLAIGSGGNFALSAAKALMAHSQLGAKEITLASMEIAADLCIFTNNSIVVETIKGKP
jgi:ATP-dependent HslUV protease subunit HslV